MNSGQIAGNTILFAGFVMMIVGLALIPLVDPLVGGVIFVVGISDVVVGTMFRSGRLGQQRSPQQVAQEAADQRAESEANAAAYGTTADGATISGDANPYARED